jgi:hypothetical protein
MRKNTLKASIRTIVVTLLLALASAQSGRANLVTDGTFTGVTDLSGNPSTGYGQFGPDPSSGSVATGALLKVTSWTTDGYNFVFTPGTIDGGTNSGGPNAGVPTQTGGQSPNTYMWGKNNGGTTAIPNAPGGGNIIAADGAYEVAPIQQTISGLTVGQTYVLKFNFAGAQQQGYTAATTEKWIVSMGTGVFAGNFSTATQSVPGMGFSGWQTATMYFYAGSATETLSFLAAGTPNGQPPFSLLADVDLEVVPDFSNWMVFTGFGVACILFEMMRRRRRMSASPAAV